MGHPAGLLQTAFIQTHEHGFQQTVENPAGFDVILVFFPPSFLSNGLVLTVNFTARSPLGTVLNFLHAWTLCPTVNQLTV